MSLNFDIDGLNTAPHGLSSQLPESLRDVWTVAQEACGILLDEIEEGVRRREELIDFAEEHKDQLSQETIDEGKRTIERTDEILYGWDARLDEFGDKLRELGLPAGDCDSVLRPEPLQ